jgi:tetratricopeptide (TPR) repeat protein
MVIDFEVRTLREDVVRVLQPKTREERQRAAFDLYRRASELDENPETMPTAEALYLQAIELDPALAIAYTNLGNIAFRRGNEPEAVQMYHRALKVDREQPEAQYNLGYVLLDRGKPAEALPYFEGAVRSDGDFADAHFYLAMTYESVGLREKARPAWRRYLELEPTGTWADIARRHLLALARLCRLPCAGGALRRLRWLRSDLAQLQHQPQGLVHRLGRREGLRNFVVELDEPLGFEKASIQLVAAPFADPTCIGIGLRSAKIVFLAHGSQLSSSSVLCSCRVATRAEMMRRRSPRSM